MSSHSDRYALYSIPNPLPTPAPSISSRNASPHSGYRRPFETLEQSDANPTPNLGSLAYGSSSDMFSIASHEISLDAPPSERTNAFFTSQSAGYKLPTPPRRSSTLSSKASRDGQLLSDKLTDLARSRSERRASPPRSSTQVTFYKGPRTPSPPFPPHLSTSNGLTSSIPPLSRFFPSRYRRARDALDESATFTSSPPKAPSLTFSLSPPQSPPSDGNSTDFPVASQEASTQVHREQPLTPNTSRQPEEGSCYESDDTKLTYLRCVGKGAFSSVWLARDDNGGFSHDQQPHERRPSESVAGRRRDKKMDGLKPTHPGATLSFSVARLPPLPHPNDQIKDVPQGSENPLMNDGPQHVNESKPGRLVAVKMMDLTVCDANDRTRIAFVREVEVLRHISHPNIVSYLHSFTTPEHHCLVLEYIGGGELFELANSSENFSRMTEELLRKIWGELALAVGWMHNVALVHRDIKLENIILTRDPFASPSDLIDVESLPSPLVKLTDFGLARFIDPTNPLLTTRCGSEYYSAPEIIMAQPYDGRRTDAWACGVVLFALATRVLPFDVDVSRFSHGASGRETGSKIRKDSKRSYMLRIAKGEYHWPGETNLRRSSSGASATSSRRSSLTSSDEGHLHWSSLSFGHGLSRPASSCGSLNGDAPRSHHSASASVEGHGEGEIEVVHQPNPNVLVTGGVKRIVGKLLVRDPRKRWRIVDLWTDEWMRGRGAPLPPPEALLEDQTPSASTDERTTNPVALEKGSNGNGNGSEGDWVPVFHSHRRSTSGRLVLAQGDTIPIVARQEIAMQ